MANSPQKSDDPMADTLNAIEAALKLGDGDSDKAPAVKSPAEGDGADKASQEAQPELAVDEPQTAWQADETPPRPANDDRANIGQMLQGLHQRPASRTPFILATVAAVAWAAGAAGTAFMFRPELQELFAAPRMSALVALGAFVAVALPIVAFYVLALLIRRSQEMRAVAESMADVALRLAQPETVATESVMSVGHAIRREVAAMGDGVERALARAAELESLVHNEVSAIERAYNDNEVRIRGLLSDLANQRETLVAQGEHVRTAISSVHLDLSHDITSVGDLVADKVQEVAQRVTRSLTEKGEYITLALGHAGDSMIDALSERGSSLLERLESTSERSTGAVTTAGERTAQAVATSADHVTQIITAANQQLTESLKFKGDTVAQEFDDLAARLQQMMNARLDQVAHGFAQNAALTIENMGVRSEAFTGALTETGKRMVDDMAARAEDLHRTLQNTGDSLVQNIGQRGDDVVGRLELTGDRVTETLASRSTAIADSFRDSTDTLINAVDARGEAVKEMLITRLKSFDEMFQHGGTELTEKISRDAGTLGNLITRHISEFDRTVKTYGGELVERLGQRTQDVSEAMRSHLESFDQRVGQQITTAAETITARGNEVADTLDTRINRFEELLIGRASAVAEHIENRTKQAADAVHARVEQLAESIKVNTTEAERSLGDLTQSTTEAIRGSASEAERTLRGASDEISASIGQRAEELTTLLSDRSGGVIAALSEQGEHFAFTIGSATDKALEAIEAKGLSFSRTVLDNSNEISDLINAAGENASNSVNRTITELQDTTQQAIARSKDSAEAAVQAMEETHNMLRSDSIALFERLREANTMLQEVLSGAHENMNSLESTLMLRVSEFVTAMNEVTGTTTEVTTRVENNITGFREVTAQLITDLGQLANQFDEHGRDLAQSIELMDRSNQRTEDAVNQRRVQLDELVGSLDARTEDIQQRLSRFSGLLDESLEAAAGRARDVARAVSEATAEGTRAISDQYERVREHAQDVAHAMLESSAESTRRVGEQYEHMRTQAEDVARGVAASTEESARALSEQFDHIRTKTEDERRRTVETMRTIYQQSSGDTEGVFREATARFAEVMDNMKEMAAEMQRELETTRGELRRGIFELPQETAESAAQMRRVIVDQIEALAELNRIVARHGRNIDAIEPMRRSAREEPTLAVVGGRASEAPSRSEPARGLPPLRPSSQPRNELPGFAPSRRSEAPSPASQEGSSRGWLSDLLNRASQEPEPPSREPGRGADERTPRHTIESLDSLSVDIARMIDHEAAADLWDRYKRGERNVFTRRLYTLQGQKAFDEIRRKYRGDREFKQTVDGYISHFERLLEDASRDDPSGMMARTYLTSETGKVYTMLAHAAGRFD